jgi:hypothetical protein
MMRGEYETGEAVSPGCEVGCAANLVRRGLGSVPTRRAVAIGVEATLSADGLVVHLAQGRKAAANPLARSPLTKLLGELTTRS